MDDNKFYLSVVAIVVAAFFFGFLIYVIWSQQTKGLVTTADIERAREIVRRAELGR